MIKFKYKNHEFSFNRYNSNSNRDYKYNFMNIYSFINIIDYKKSLKNI